MLITGVHLCWNAEGRTRATAESSIGDSDPYAQHHQVFSLPPFYLHIDSYVSDGKLGLSQYHTIHFLISSFCYICDSSCFECSNLLYIDLTLQFVWGRHVLYTFSYTDLSRPHV